jgi:OOP family OmpA-OmpF porin
MRFNKLILIFVLLCFKVQAQNLVPNSSFESSTACPNFYNQIYFATPWFQPNNFINGSWQQASNSDLFNSCATWNDVRVPNNFAGSQYSRTGNGYAGIFIFGAQGTDWREYMEVGLDAPLIQGRRYCVEFFVSRGAKYTVAIDRIGVYFSLDSVLYNGTLFYNPLIVNPQVENEPGNIISDAINWVPIRGSFIAQGGEKFMVIGNFRDSANTSWSLLGSPSYAAAYYYIDDISVYELSTDSASCFYGVGISEMQMGNGISIYPNPVNDKLVVKSSEFRSKTEIIIYNLIGEKIYDSEIRNAKTEIDVSTLPKGIYFVQLKSEKKTSSQKFIISR